MERRGQNSAGGVRRWNPNPIRRACKPCLAPAIRLEVAHQRIKLSLLDIAEVRVKRLARLDGFSPVRRRFLDVIGHDGHASAKDVHLEPYVPALESIDPSAPWRRRGSKAG
jgi:hypothetical protein